MVAIKRAMEPEIKEEAEQRMQKGDPRQKFAEGKSVEQFAEVVHSNPETVRQALYIEFTEKKQIKE